MIVYHYDPDTGVYLNTSSAADPDPLESGHWLIPANATDKVPPSVPNPKTQQQVFHEDEDAWTVELIPVTPALEKNISEAPREGLWPRVNIVTALKGGVS